MSLEWQNAQFKSIQKCKGSTWVFINQYYSTWYAKYIHKINYTFSAIGVKEKSRLGELGSSSTAKWTGQRTPSLYFRLSLRGWCYLGHSYCRRWCLTWNQRRPRREPPEGLSHCATSPTVWTVAFPSHLKDSTLFYLHGKPRQRHGHNLMSWKVYWNSVFQKQFSRGVFPYLGFEMHQISM